MSGRLEKLLALHAQDPEDDFTTYAIALEHRAAGDEREALAWLDRTIALAPDHAYAWYQKAALLAELEELEEAAAAVREGIAAARRAGDAKAEAELSLLAEQW